MTDERRRRDHGEGGREMQAANLFDLRRIIGGLFVLYGAILVIVGLQDGTAAIRQAAGVHINLWAGIGMLALGGAFLAWAFLRPLGEQLQEAEARAEAADEEPRFVREPARERAGTQSSATGA